MRDVVVNLPPGIVGNVTAVPRCSRRQFDGELIRQRIKVIFMSRRVRLRRRSVSTRRHPTAFRVFRSRCTTWCRRRVWPPSSVQLRRGAGLHGFGCALGWRRVRWRATTGSARASIPFRRRGSCSTRSRSGGSRAKPATKNSVEGPSGAGSTPLLTVPTSCEGPQEISIEALGSWQNENARARASVLTHNTHGRPGRVHGL